MNFDIHTIEFLYKGTFNYFDLLFMENEFKEIREPSKYNKDIEYIVYKYQAKNIEYKYYKQKIIKDHRLTHVLSNVVKKIDLEYMKIIVNPSKILYKNSISINDYDIFINEFLDRHNSIFNTKIKDISKDLALTRIDYKLDLYIPTEQQELYFNLIKKVGNNIGYLNKKSEYKTSVKFKNEFIELNIYNKEQERKDKGQEVEQYKNIIRFEIQVKKKGIDYLYSHDGLCKELFNYWCNYMYSYFMNLYLKPILFQGDYYKLKQSKKILKQFYSKNWTDKLINFQKNISKEGVTATKNKYGYNTYKTYIEKLNNAAVNPILIDDNSNMETLKNVLINRRID